MDGCPLLLLLLLVLLLLVLLLVLVLVLHATCCGPSSSCSFCCKLQSSSEKAKHTIVYFCQISAHYVTGKTHCLTAHAIRRSPCEPARLPIPAVLWSPPPPPAHSVTPCHSTAQRTMRAC